MTTEIETGPIAIELATALTIAWLSNPNTRAAAEPALAAQIEVAGLQPINPAIP